MTTNLTTPPAAEPDPEVLGLRAQLTIFAREVGARSGRPTGRRAREDHVSRSRHERGAGGGYPRGRRGPQVPVEGGVVAIADPSDAMTAGRPYRQAMQVEVALDEIAGGSGK